MSDPKENIENPTKKENKDGGVGNAISVPTLPSLIAAPNSKPREKEAHLETYTYRDFANADQTTLDNGGGRVPAASLQSQKLPSKLAAMLSDPDLTSVITWMPHGRSWKILNRELFSTFALPRYFGHSNHASFVRIVNAWGFRRINIGLDRDSYYHELFLRCKPNLHQRMKRLPSCHRKTPVDKDDRSPDFYELAKASPLPEVSWGNSNGNIGGIGQSVPNGMPLAGANGGGPFPPHLGSMMGMMGNTPNLGDTTGGFPANGLMGNGMIGGNVNGMGMNMNMNPFGMGDPNQMLSFLNGNLGGPNPPTDANSLTAYTQSLQRENENLMLKIKLLEYQNQGNQLDQQQPVMNGNGGQQNSNPASGVGTSNDVPNIGDMSSHATKKEHDSANVPVNQTMV